MLQVKFGQRFAVLLCLTSGRRLTTQIEATLRRVLRDVSATCGACARTAVSVHGVNYLLYQRCTVGTQWLDLYHKTVRPAYTSRWRDVKSTAQQPVVKPDVCIRVAVAETPGCIGQVGQSD